MHTGDGGFLDADGFLTVVDRMKDMIITGGENVYSVEVENAIAQHPAVAQCTVIGIPSKQWGEQVHAVVVPHADAAPTAEELMAFCRTLLGGFKIPAASTFVTRRCRSRGPAKCSSETSGRHFGTAMCGM